MTDPVLDDPAAIAHLTGVRVYWFPESVEVRDEFSRAHVSERCPARAQEVPEERLAGRMTSGSVRRAANLGLALCADCAGELVRARLEARVARAARDEMLARRRAG